MTRLSDGSISLNRPKTGTPADQKPAKPKTCPCTTCGTPTEMLGTKKCERCWRVENHLVEYLKSPGGRSRAADILRSQGYRVMKLEAE